MKLFVLLLVIVLFVLWKKNQAKEKAFKDQLSDALKEGLFKGGPFRGSNTHRSNSPGHNKETSSGKPAAAVDELIACAICGLHTPKSQLVMGHRQQYQCAKHG
jgi:uncharacterized protein